MRLPRLPKGARVMSEDRPQLPAERTAAREALRQAWLLSCMRRLDAAKELRRAEDQVADLFARFIESEGAE